MKWFTTLAAVLAMAFLATSMTMANDGKEKKDRPAPAAHGVLVSATDTQIVLKDKKDVETTVKVDATTTVKIDGKDAKLADLKPGMRVYVPTLENGVAKTVKASTKPEGEHEHPAPKK